MTGAGKAVPVQAWRRYDVFGDDEATAVTFRYGEAEHGIVGQVDLTGIPVAVAVGVAADAASLIEAMSREDDPFDRVERIGLAEARRRLEEPLARCDEEADPSLAVDTVAYLPVARSRVRRLPAEGAAAVPVFAAADRAAAVDDFLKSPLAADAVAADEDADAVLGRGAHRATAAACPASRPARSARARSRACCLATCRTPSASPPRSASTCEPAVTAWTRWSAEHRDLDEARDRPPGGEPARRCSASSARPTTTRKP